MTKVFCDKCGKELTSAILEISDIHVKSGKRDRFEHEMVKNVVFTKIKHIYAFDNEEFTLTLCYDCSVKFKKVFDLFMKKN